MALPPMNYVEPPDVPEGMTLAAYRIARAQPARRRRLVVRARRRVPADSGQPVRSARH